MIRKMSLLFVFFVLAPLCLAQEPQSAMIGGNVEVLDKVSLDIRGMDILDVLKMLAVKANLNLVIDKNVSGKVTVFLKNVSSTKAFDTILASNGLAQENKDGITRIMTVLDYEQSHGYKYNDIYKTKRVDLKYLKPADAAGILNQ